MLAVLIAFIFFTALSLRLFLAPLGFHIDILSVAGWGEWIYKNGALGFYENNVWLYAWPTQPPLMNLILGFDKWLYIYLLEFFRFTGNMIVKYHLAPGHMIWWFEFTKWFDTSRVSVEAAFSTGFLITIKLLPILGDLAISIIIFLIAQKNKIVKFPLIWPSIYLFSPFSLYLSALWGQYDQIAFVPVLLAFLFESRKRYPVLNPLLFAIGIAVKPTSLILVPFFAYIYFKNRHSIKTLIFSALLVALLFILSTIPFTRGNIFIFSKDILFEKIFLKSASRLSANAFNFWRIISATGGETAAYKIFLIPAYVWSAVIYIFLNILAFKLASEVNLKNVIRGMFIVAAGSWIFMTNMLDRYLFAGIATGLILCLYNKNILKYWLIFSLIFFVNLFNQWWYPDFFDPLKTALQWNGGLATKVLSVINTLLFLRISAYAWYNKKLK